MVGRASRRSGLRCAVHCCIMRCTIAMVRHQTGAGHLRQQAGDVPMAFPGRQASSGLMRGRTAGHRLAGHAPPERGPGRPEASLLLGAGAPGDLLARPLQLHFSGVRRGAVCRARLLPPRRVGERALGEMSVPDGIRSCTPDKCYECYLNDMQC
jgi:hypothetical protein